MNALLWLLIFVYSIGVYAALIVLAGDMWPTALVISLTHVIVGGFVSKSRADKSQVIKVRVDGLVSDKDAVISAVSEGLAKARGVRFE